MALKKESALKVAAKKLLKNKLATASFIFIVLQLIIVVFAPLFTKFDPTEQSIVDQLKPMFTDGHILGTDYLGRDMWSRIVYGGRTSLAVGFCATFIGGAVGTVFGLLAGYYKKLDMPIMRIMDILSIAL